MKTRKTGLPGCLLIEPDIFEDKRGRLVKTFHEATFKKLGLPSVFKEEYYSISQKNVIRGMHFQLPPKDHCKLVYCSSGSVFDVIVDLRLGSPTYGKCISFNLGVSNGRILYIPSGLAHGFCSLEDNTTMMYRASTEYSPKYDSGILWHSMDIDWPTDQPIISERDQGFCTIDKFDTPFTYSELE